MKKLEDRHEQLEYLLDEDKGMCQPKELLGWLVQAMSNGEFDENFKYIVRMYEIRKPFKVSFRGKDKCLNGNFYSINEVMYNNSVDEIKEQINENYELITELKIEECEL